MAPLLDIGFVMVGVGAAVAYLVLRKVRALKRINRDWATGHAATCDHCPAIQIREAQRRKIEWEDLK
jgi:hypothetical protein